MLFLKVLLLSFRLFAAEPDFEEQLPTEPEVIHLEIHWLCKYCDTEIITDPYAELIPIAEPLPVLEYQPIF